MTTFGDQVYQYGGAPITSGRPLGMFSDKVIFVDGTNGSDSNDGKTPKRAVASLSQATTLITTKGGVIYMREKDRSDSDPGYYSEAATLTLGTHDGIAIIGTGANHINPFGCQIKGSTAASPIIDCMAAFVTIENIDFNRGDTTTGGVRFYDKGGSTGYNLGNNISNCHFRNLRGSGDGSTGAAVIVYGGVYTSIRNNHFYQCRGGILLNGGPVSVIQGMEIVNNIFQGETGTVDTDICITSSTNDNKILIAGNYFGHDVPAYSGGLTAYIYTAGGYGMIANNWFGTDDAVASSSPGATDEIYCPTTILLVGNYDQAGLVARA